MSSKPATSRVNVGCTEDKKKECEKKKMKCYEETGVCHSLKFFEKKSTSKSLKPAPEVQKKTPSPVQKQVEIKTDKTIRNFIKELRNYKTAKEAIEKIFKTDKDDVKDAKEAIEKIKKIEEGEKDKDKENTKSRQGFIYELLWDICIKFNITDFTNKHTEHGIGNFNIFSNFEKIEKHIDEYLKQGYISGNSGGYSDITFRTKQEETDTNYDLNLVSVKYYYNDKRKNIKDYDIQNLCTLIQNREKQKEYKGNKINLLLFVNNKEKFKKIKYNKSSNVLIKYISPRGNYENVYDLNDLERHYSKLWKILKLYNFLENDAYFKKNFLNVKEKILKSFVPRFHQQLIIKSIQKHINKEKKILVGAIPRSGKTYIMAGTILEDVNKNLPNTFKNYIIITPAPTETLSQYEDAFNDYIDFKEKNIKVVNVKKEGFKPYPNKNIVYIISKQKLGIHNKENEDELKNNKQKADKIAEKVIKLINGIKFEIMFYDEAHYGMSTTIAEIIFKSIKSKDQKEIYVTATYNKPTNVYNITKIFNWGLQDINFLNNYKNNKIDKLIEYFSKNYDEDIVNEVVKENFNNNVDYITKDYKHFPEPFLLTSVWHKEFLDEQLRLLEGEPNYGFDMDKLFTYLKDGITFENEPQLKILFEYYLGYPIKKGSFSNINYFVFKEIEKENIKDKKNISQDEKYKELNIIDIISKSNTLYDDIIKECKNIYYEKDSNIYIPIPEYEYKNRDYKDVDFIKKRGIVPRIREVCMNECRTLQHVKHKTSQLWFLPGGTPGRLLDNIIFSLLYFLKNNFNDFFKSHMFFICRTESEIKTTTKSDKQEIKDKIERNKKEYDKLIKEYKNISFQQEDNGKDSKDIKTQIKNIEKSIKNEDKYRGLIILTGGKLKLGVSLPNVDIVTLFSNTMSTDSIFQMLFRSMTEIEDNTECNISEYCPKKKYGFMVDLKPQRILRTLNYINTKMLSKEQQNEDNKKEYIPIGDLINIDKDVFINKYDYKKSKKEIKNEIIDYSKAYFEKLLDTNDYSNNKDIKNVIDLYDFDLDKFDKDILWYLQNFDLSQAAFDKKLKEREAIPTGKKVERKSQKKQDEENEDGGEDDEDDKEPDIDEDKGKDKEKDKKEDKVDEVDENKIKENLKEIVIISISLLSLICDNYCLFDNKNNNINMPEINKIFEDMKENKKNICNYDGEDNLYEIFINGFKDRITNNIPGKSKEDMFNIIKDIFSNNIKEKDDDIKGGGKKTGGNIISLNHLLKSKRQKIYTIETPDKLLEQINKTLPFTKKAKDERGEVFTPMELVNEMLDTLPKEVWKNPNLKWLDPAAGMGNFPVAVYMRLMEGLKGYKDEEKRRKHILEEMLYMVELDKTNVFMMKKIFCGKKYELNIFEGSFIDGKYEKKIDIFSINDNEKKKIKIQKNIDFVDKIKEFNNNFDIIMGNPPYNQGGISSKKKNIELEQDKKTIWTDFIEKSFTILKTSGYLLFVNPLSWVKNTHKLHKVMFEKYIIYLELWDVNNGKKLINGELPISIFLLQNIKNTNKNKTTIKVKNDRYNYNDDFKEYLDKDLSLPLGYIDELLKLRRFVIKNNCSLEYKTTKSNDITLKKNQQKKLNELKYMSIDDIKKIKETDKYCIDTYDLRDKQYQLNITKSYHPDYNKRKLILSHKSELAGIFIDSGKLGICGTHNYYITGNNLTLITKILSFDIIKKAGIYTKYGQNFLDADFFTYVPDLRKLEYTNITEDEFNKLIGIGFIKNPKRGNKSASLPKRHKVNKLNKRNKTI